MNITTCLSVALRVAGHPKTFLCDGRLTYTKLCSSTPVIVWIDPCFCIRLDRAQEVGGTMILSGQLNINEGI
ncbi:hypothetical protein BDQ94DRAFT_142737 [Aspergillus welwitschiae]|uniref:Uncharacterized protein n=1 Tax=Aspergillus welwitschiae TaxID=1341132 RepID=A0A3F3Q553_9EURO|nr:hypothetical protein BDQ94DRAFT_142737 [Aspergillus welwitschiae]RDH33826.1 hypothetical protein BDQ94DRAFT_142737 [Aspergillus welwitschiae]